MAHPMHPDEAARSHAAEMERIAVALDRARVAVAAGHELQLRMWLAGQHTAVEITKTRALIARTDAEPAFARHAAS